MPTGTVKEEDLRTYVLVKPKDSNPWWYEEDTSLGEIRWYNTAGGYRTPIKGDKVLARTTAADWPDLDWSKTKLLDPTSKSGWLSPDGKFYGCAYQAHESLAWLILKSDGQTLEKRWMHIWGPYLGSPAHWSKPDRGATRAQLEWLDKNGHEVNEWDWEELDK